MEADILALKHKPTGWDIPWAFTFFQIPIIEDILAFTVDGPNNQKKGKKSVWTIRTQK